MSIKIEIGMRLGRLIVGDLVDDAPRKMRRCLCDCGNDKDIRIDSLQSGRTQSCGCLRDEAAKRTGLSMIKHGHAKQCTGETSAEYTAWLSMKARCNNKKNKNWHRYGGRGVLVYPLWENDFGAFLAHIGCRPSARHSVDRHPNNDGNYEPGNVRWATQKEQKNNRSNNKRYIIEGEFLTAAEAALKYGKRADLVYLRLSRGWSPEMAVGLI